MRGSSRTTPLATALVAGVFACSKTQDPAPPETTLPPETAPGLECIPFEDTGTWSANDTGGTVTNLEPSATVRILQTGDWTLSPAGGPWDALSGLLQVNEYPDGVIDTGTDTAVDTAEPPPCDVVFSVSGTLAEAQNCPDCDLVFEVVWTLVEGDPGPCRDPDLPIDATHWRLGYSAARETLQFDYYDSGVWVDWYTAVEQGDVMRVGYDTTKAVAVEEE